jgi:hypothetical protein
LTENAVREYFAELGLKDIKFKHGDDGRFVGSCMIEFETSDGADNALMADGMQVV